MLRDYYVNTAVKTQDPNQDYEFLNPKRYELDFLHMLDEKFNIKNPTIILFFKKRFMYDFEFPEILDQIQKSKTIQGDLFSGFNRKGRTSYEVTVTPEMKEMQKCLDSLCTNPRPSYAAE